MALRRLAFGILLLGLLVATGCASKPIMRLHHAELRSASFQGVGLDVFLQVENPNSYDIRIRNVRATVLLADRHPLPPIVYSPNQWLPSGEKTMVRVPMLIPYVMIPTILAETVMSPMIRFSVRGRADVTAVRMLGIERDDYPIDERGTISRFALAAAAGM